MKKLDNVMKLKKAKEKQRYELSNPEEPQQYQFNLDKHQLTIINKNNNTDVYQYDKDILIGFTISSKWIFNPLYSYNGVFLAGFTNKRKFKYWKKPFERDYGTFITMSDHYCPSECTVTRQMLLKNFNFGEYDRFLIVQDNLSLTTYMNIDYLNSFTYYYDNKECYYVYDNCYGYVLHNQHAHPDFESIDHNTLILNFGLVNIEINDIYKLNHLLQKQLKNSTGSYYLKLDSFCKVINEIVQNINKQ